MKTKVVIALSAATAIATGLLILHVALQPSPPQAQQSARQNPASNTPGTYRSYLAQTESSLVDAPGASPIFTVMRPIAATSFGVCKFVSAG